PLPIYQPQKRRLPGAVRADDADSAAFLDVERDVLHGPKLIFAPRPEAAQSRFLQRLRPVGAIAPVAFPNSAQRDRVRHHSSSGKRYDNRSKTRYPIAASARPMSASTTSGPVSGHRP